MARRAAGSGADAAEAADDLRPALAMLAEELGCPAPARAPTALQLGKAMEAAAVPRGASQEASREGLALPRRQHSISPGASFPVASSVMPHVLTCAASADGRRGTALRAVPRIQASVARRPPRAADHALAAQGRERFPRPPQAGRPRLAAQRFVLCPHMHALPMTPMCVVVALACQPTWTTPDRQMWPGCRRWGVAAAESSARKLWCRRAYLRRWGWGGMHTHAHAQWPHASFPTHPCTEGYEAHVAWPEVPMAALPPRAACLRSGPLLPLMEHARAPPPPLRPTSLTLPHPSPSTCQLPYTLGHWLSSPTAHPPGRELQGLVRRRVPPQPRRQHGIILLGGVDVLGEGAGSVQLLVMSIARLTHCVYAMRRSFCRKETGGATVGG